MATTCRRLKTCPPSDVASASERGQLAQMWRDFASTVHNSARSRPDFLKQSTCLRCLWQPVQLRRIRSLHGKPHALLRAKLPEIKASDQVASNTRWSLQSAFRFRPALPPYVESWSVSPVFRTAKRGVLISTRAANGSSIGAGACRPRGLPGATILGPDCRYGRITRYSCQIHHEKRRLRMFEKQESEDSLQEELQC
jgi:hypothetical protein